jgi:hypothetical protein
MGSVDPVVVTARLVAKPADEAVLACRDVLSCSSVVAITAFHEDRWPLEVPRGFASRTQLLQAPPCSGNRYNYAALTNVAADNRTGKHGFFSGQAVTYRLVCGSSLRATGGKAHG